MAQQPSPRRRAEGLPAARVCAPAAWELADASALQALAFGEASPDQQRRALKFLIERVSCAYDLSYRPESERDTAFAEGRRFVGLQIIKLLNLNLAKFRSAAPGEQPPPSEQG